MTQNYPVKARPLSPPFSASTVTAASGFIKLVYNWYKYRFISFIDILSFGHHNLVLRLSDYSIRACLKLILLLSLVKNQHLTFQPQIHLILTALRTSDVSPTMICSCWVDFTKSKVETILAFLNRHRITRALSIQHWRPLKKVDVVSIEQFLGWFIMNWP